MITAYVVWSGIHRLKTCHVSVNGEYCGEALEWRITVDEDRPYHGGDSSEHRSIVEFKMQDRLGADAWHRARQKRVLREILAVALEQLHNDLQHLRTATLAAVEDLKEKLS